MMWYHSYLYDFSPFLFFDKGTQELLPAVEIITSLSMKPLNKRFLWTMLSLYPLPCTTCLPTHIFSPPSYILYFPADKFETFWPNPLNTYTKKPKKHMIGTHLEHVKAVYLKCRHVERDIISYYGAQAMSLSVFFSRESSVWSLGYHDSIMSSVSLSYSLMWKWSLINWKERQLPTLSRLEEQKAECLSKPGFCPADVFFFLLLLPTHPQSR